MTVWGSRKNDAWIEVTSIGKHCRAKLKIKNKIYIHLSNTYASLHAFSADPPPTITKSPAPDHGAPNNTTKPTPIPKPSTKPVGVADSGVSFGTHVTRLPFTQLSHKAYTAGTFTNFPNSLMSVGTKGR